MCPISVTAKRIGNNISNRLPCFGLSGYVNGGKGGENYMSRKNMDGRPGHPIYSAWARVAYLFQLFTRSTGARVNSGAAIMQVRKKSSVATVPQDAKL